MNTESTTPLREAFVLRVWSETPGTQNWRGQLQHVRTGELVSFQDIEEMFAYIREKIRESPTPSETGLR